MCVCVHVCAWPRLPVCPSPPRCLSFRASCVMSSRCCDVIKVIFFNLCICSYFSPIKNRKHQACLFATGGGRGLQRGRGFRVGPSLPGLGSSRDNNLLLRLLSLRGGLLTLAGPGPGTCGGGGGVVFLPLPGADQSPGFTPAAPSFFKALYLYLGGVCDPGPGPPGPPQLLTASCGGRRLGPGTRWPSSSLGRGAQVSVSPPPPPGALAPLKPPARGGPGARLPAPRARRPPYRWCRWPW